MTPNSIACPQCKTVYQVRTEFTGKKVRCTSCNAVFLMPEVAQAPAGPAPSVSACPFCGAKASGKFCSMCGSRLRGVPDFDFASCKIPAHFINQFPADYMITIGGDPEEQSEARRQHAIYDACTRFNSELDEMARELKYGGFESSSWRFNRVQIGRLVDNLPLDVPSREGIIARLWGIISDVERSMRQSHIKDKIQEADEALKASDAKRASRAIESIRELLSEFADPATSRRLDEFLVGLKALDQKSVHTKQLSAYQKLLDKADKLAFQQDWKKAIKAYQECLFWLSRNDVSYKERLTHEVQQKLNQAQVALPS